MKYKYASLTVLAWDRYVKALKEGAQSAPSEAGRQEYGMQAERLYSRTETLMQRWASAFKVPALIHSNRKECIFTAVLT